MAKHNNTNTNTINTINNEENNMTTNNIIIDTTAKTVTRKGVSVRQAAGQPEYKLGLNIDFSNMPLEQIFELASRTITISVQSALRRAPVDFLKSQSGKTLSIDATNPSKILEDESITRAREQANLLKRAKNMSGDELEALITLLREQQANG